MSAFLLDFQLLCPCGKIGIKPDLKICNMAFKFCRFLNDEIFKLVTTAVFCLMKSTVMTNRK